MYFDITNVQQLVKTNFGIIKSSPSLVVNYAELFFITSDKACVSYNLQDSVPNRFLNVVDCGVPGLLRESRVANEHLCVQRCLPTHTPD